MRVLRKSYGACAAISHVRTAEVGFAGAGAGWNKNP